MELYELYLIQLFKAALLIVLFMLVDRIAELIRRYNRENR